MRYVNNEKGVALVTALMLTMVSLVVCLSLLYIITQSTKSTASKKVYSTAISASYGGAEMIKDVMPRLLSYSSAKTAITGIGSAGDFNSVNLAFSTTANDQTCLNDKLKKATKDWSNICTADNKSPNAIIKPDFTLKLNGPTAGTGFKVAAKIVNTVTGNSDPGADPNIDLAFGVSQGGSGGVVAPQHLPSLYTIEVSSQREVNAKERADVSVVYAY